MAENALKELAKSSISWIKYDKTNGLEINFRARDYFMIWISISSPMILEFAKWLISKVF